METTPQPILLAQCKAYQSIEDASKIIENLLQTQFIDLFHLHISLPYSLIQPLTQKFAGAKIAFGAEILLDIGDGSFTDSIAGKILHHNQAKFVLIGTEQERTFHSSSSQLLKRKVKAALDTKVTPFVCIGDTLHEHQDKMTKKILSQQLKECLEDLSCEDLKQLYIVYQADWISRTLWEATSPELQEAYTSFDEAILEALGREKVSKNQLILTVPAYSEELAKLIKHLQTTQESPQNFSLGILDRNFEFLYPLSEPQLP